MNSITQRFYFFMLTWVTLVTQANSSFDDVHSSKDDVEIKLKANKFSTEMNQIEFWLETQDLPFEGSQEAFSSQSCQLNMAKIDALLKRYFYAIHLQKLALDCHNLLHQTDDAQFHEKHLLKLAELVTQSGDGSSYQSAFWTTDMKSAYAFLKLAGYEVVDGKLTIHDKQLYLDVYVNNDTLFGEYKHFLLNDFIQNINQGLKAELDSEEQKYLDIMNLVLKSELGNNMALINLAYAGVSEAQILLGDLMLSKTDLYPTMYSDSLALFKDAANNDSAIGKYKYAYRIFIDKIKDRYAEGHQNITSAIEQKFLPAFTLAVIVREKELGIDRDNETINDLLTLISTKADKPGYLEYLIGQQFLSDQRWNDLEISQKYFKLSADKNHPDGMVGYADSLNYGLTGREKNKRALQWYQKAAATEQSGLAYLRIGQQLGTGDGMKQNTQAAIRAFVRAGELGLSEGYLFAGHLNHFQEYKIQNDLEAFKWYQKASELDNPHGIFQHALMLFQGRGVAEDHDLAFKTFLKADKLGFHDAKIFLAAMYETGQGTLKDQKKAQRLYRQIAGNYNLNIANKWQVRKLAELNKEMITSGHEQPLVPFDGHLDLLEEQTKADNLVATYQLGYLGFTGYSDDLQRVKGLRRIKSAAKDGMKDALFYMSKEYRWDKRNKKADEYLSNAVKQNQAAAIYVEGLRAEASDPKKYIENLQQAHKLLHMPSSVKLAGEYETGKHVEKDLIKAIEYYERAIELGGGNVVYDLVDLYLSLDTEVSDIEQAISELKFLAETNNDSKAMRNLGEIYANQLNPNTDMNEAIKWLIKAYEAGDTETGVMLGKMNFYGIGLPQNFDLALFFFANGATRKSKFIFAEYFDEPGSFWLALMMQHGKGLEQDYQAASELYLANFSSVRSKEAKNNYAVMTCQSSGADVEKQAMSFELLKTLSDNSRTAQFNLGWMFEHGLCTEQNHEAALQHYRKAAERGSPHALYKMYELHQTGQWVEADTKKAEEFLKESLQVSKSIKYHNMMSTFWDLPYIVDFQLQEKDQQSTSL